MEFRVLAIGDVTSEEGTAHLRRHLPGFKKMRAWTSPLSTARTSPAPA